MSSREPSALKEKKMGHFDAEQEARKRWGVNGVAINGQLRMVGYFEEPHRAVPLFPWVKCGEGTTWEDAFLDAEVSR